MTTSETLPEDVAQALEEFEDAVPCRGWDHDHERYLSARTALVAAVLRYGEAERGRGIEEAQTVCLSLAADNHNRAAERSYLFAAEKIGALLSPSPSRPDTDKETNRE